MGKLKKGIEMKQEELYQECIGLLADIETLQWFDLLKLKCFLQKLISFLHESPFEELLRNNNIHFQTKDGIITINHNGYVPLNSLTQLPDNVQFNNKGSVYLPSLTQLPDNVQFNNKGYVYLNSLTQLPENKEQIFKNDGIVWYNQDKQYDPRIGKKDTYSFFVEGVSYRYFIYKGGNLCAVSKRVFDSYEGFKTILR